MKIVALSDIHGQYDIMDTWEEATDNPWMPEGDVLVVAGDLTSHGTMRNIIDLRTWLDTLPYEHIVLVAGNHDAVLESKSSERAIEILCGDGKRIHYLQNQGISIGDVYFYGMPYMPDFYNWSFMLPRNSSTLSAMVDTIPEKVDVLITHGPPYGILDTTGPTYGQSKMGCELLAKKVKELPNLKAHIFGHNHGEHGSEGVFHNVSVLDESYTMVRPPTTIEI